MTDQLSKLTKDYWDAVNARQPERAAEIMKQIGAETTRLEKPALTKTKWWPKTVRW